MKIGITQRMRKASTKEERQKLLSQAKKYQFISSRTMRKLERLAAR